MTTKSYTSIHMETKQQGNVNKGIHYTDINDLELQIKGIIKEYNPTDAVIYYPYIKRLV